MLTPVCPSAAMWPVSFCMPMSAGEMSPHCSAVELLVLSKAWNNKFSRQDIEEKKVIFLKNNAKYHTCKEKKADKKDEVSKGQIHYIKKGSKHKILADKDSDFKSSL